MTRLAEEQLRCAVRLLADARELAAGSEDLAVHLDLAVADRGFGRALGEPGPEAPRRSLGRAAELLRAARDVPPWLYGGAAHVGWTLVTFGASPGALAAVDEVVGAWIAEFPEEHDVDLPRGLLGLGVYALVHPDPATREHLTRGVLDVVAARAEHDGDGMFLRLAGSAPRRADGSAGCAVVGVAHGAAGLVSYLASVSASGLTAAARATPLLAATVRWLLRQRERRAGEEIAAWRDSGYAPSRVTWCYGDPGVALALDVAAGVTASAPIAAAAAELTRAAVGRDPAEAGVVDTCLCHGAAGLVWAGRRFVDAATTRAQRERAWGFLTHWSRVVVAARDDGPLRYFHGSGSGRDARFLSGDLGAALALLYAATGRRAVWEQVLLGVRIAPEVRVGVLR